MTKGNLSGKWALILGASSGFGAAIAQELAQNGMHIIGVHLDRKATLPNVKKIIQGIEQSRVQALFFNANAADPVKRREILDQTQKKLESSMISVFLHSLAFGTLRTYISENPRNQLSKEQMEMTLDVMANSLVYWVQDMAARKMIGRGSRIFAMTSSGARRVWPNYGAVSAAKAALESHVRQLAMELAPLGISANSVRAGVTDTPALRTIPGYEEMVKYAKLKNPHNRLTKPEDVARAIAVLSSSETGWVTGNVIGADGGEDIVG